MSKHTDGGRPSRIDIIRFTDADQASSLLSSTYAPVRLEPLAGRGFDIEISGVTLAQMQIYRSSTLNGLRFASVGHFDGFTFSRMRRGALEVEAGRAVHRLGLGADLAMDAETVDRLAMAQNSSFSGLAVGAEGLRKAVSARLGEEATRRLSFKQSHTSAGLQSSYEGICDVIHAGMGEGGPLLDNPLALRSLEDALLNLILFGTEHNYSDALARGTLELPKVVRRAVDYMHAHAHLPITTTDVAREVGIGVRSLQLSFQQWLETTPHHYLRHIRLNAARQDLLTGVQPKIGDIARKWGFKSPGEFSRLYHMAFSERPIDILQRSSPFNSPRE